jgi:predicted RNA-binding Zn ribbon-like protein
MTPHEYELIAGDPALDFVNTIHDWTVDEPRDYLTDYAEALRFGEAAGLLTRAEVKRLSARPSDRELRRLRALRGLLERVLRAIVDGRAPNPADLDTLAREAAWAARGVRLQSIKGRLIRHIDAQRARVATLRWRIADAALSLLTSPSSNLDRVKACPSCGWFFRDETKSGTRRWCSMATCGSIAKARRYYWRTRLGDGGG